MTDYLVNYKNLYIFDHTFSQKIMAPKTEEQLREIRESQKEKITSTGLKLFATEGFEKTTIGKIASEAGISKGLIYHYFSSKDAILTAIFENLQSMGQEATTFPENLTPNQCMVYMIEKIFSYIENSPEIMRFMISLAIQPYAAKKYRLHMQKEMETQVSWMENIFEKMGYEDPYYEAYYLASKLDGIAIGYITMGKDYPYEAIKQKLFKEYVYHEKPD